MHLQLPDTLVLPTEAEVVSALEILPGVKEVELDRLEFNRAARKVKFYFRNSRCKRCYSELTDEQVKTLTASLQKIGRTGNLVFDHDVYLVSPRTKRLVK